MPILRSASIALPGAWIKVSHDTDLAMGKPPEEVVVIRQPDEVDTLTRIEVWREGREAQVVLLLWRCFAAGSEVGLLFCQETQTLFVGAATFAAAVRLDEKKVIDEHVVDLFWSFQRSGGYVLELGELACYLRTLTGRIIGEAPVDPPYELFETPEGVRFESIVMGTQWLRFPHQVE